MKSIIEQWKADAEKVLNPPKNESLRVSHTQSNKRILALIELIEKKDKALQSYGYDAFDSATSLGDFDDHGYGKTARAALALTDQLGGE